MEAEAAEVPDNDFVSAAGIGAELGLGLGLGLEAEAETGTGTGTTAESVSITNEEASIPLTNWNPRIAFVFRQFGGFGQKATSIKRTMLAGRPSANACQFMYKS